MAEWPGQLVCTPGPGCAVGAAVAGLAGETARLDGELAEEKARATHRAEALHRRIDRVEDRIHAVLVGVAMTLLSTLVSIALLLLKG